MVFSKGYTFYGRKIARPCVLRYVFVSILVLSASLPLFSQDDISLDNYTGLWTDDLSWTDGTHPGTNDINDDILIKGSIKRSGGLEFKNGNLTVEDTLLIFGDLSLGNNAELNISDGGVVVVYGNYSSINKATVVAGGYLVVMGEFLQQGSSGQGSFEITSGNVFIFDDDPQYHEEGAGYTDLSCPDSEDYPDNCAFGDSADFAADPLSGFVNSGGYEISASGPLTVCGSDGAVDFSVQDLGDSYQWYQDGNPISGANSNIYTANASGNYFVEITQNAFIYSSDTVIFTINPLPVVTFSDPGIIACENDLPFDLTTGNPAGGTYSGNGITTSPEFDPGIAGPGNHIITYSYTDTNGCIDSASQTITVNALPAVSFAVVPDVCENATAFDLTQGIPAGGTYSGPGITSSPEFDPKVAGIGTHAITYTYTDTNGCTDTASQTITVNALPAVSFAVVPDVCENATAFDLTQGSPEGGTYSGPGITTSPEFDPTAPGVGTHSMIYTYNDPNGCVDSATQTITVNPVPVTSFTGLETDYCIKDDSDTLIGNYTPSGIFSGDNISDLGNGTALFTPDTEGVKSVYYKYANINGCVDSISLSTTVHPLPVTQIEGLDSTYALTDAVDTLSGNPSGGVFSGKGINGNQYDPSIAGVGKDTVLYTYTGASGCNSTDTAFTEVFDYDYIAGAITITDLDNWFSGNAVYSTETATADGNVASCWNYGNDHTRWFKFQATTEQLAATFLTGGAYGTARRINAALWEEDATTEVACNRYINNSDSVVVQSLSLTPGNWYYLSVTTGTGGYRGTFSLRVNDQVDYDYYEGAIELTDITNWDSPQAAYTTVGATADRNNASCWNTGPSYNRWFKFQATGNTISVRVRRGGTYGDIRRINAAIWEADGVTEVSCNRYISNDDDVFVESVDLIPGEWYYISVDNNYSSYRGSFSLRLDTRVSYDYKEGAYELQDINNWCSPDAFFTTRGATSDQNAASCWNTSPNYNRWFKFVATTHKINVEVKRGGDQGSIRRINVALWESDGTSQISCNRYVNNDDNVAVGTDQLVPGNTYYISVDNNYSYYRGSFTLCIDDEMDYDYLAGAKDITTLINACSDNAEYTTLGATPDETAPPCWNTSPNYNRWFKFLATTSTINVQLKRGGEFGTLRRAQLALFDSDSSTVLDCNRYVNNDDNIEVSYKGLTPGEWYFISVDNNYSYYRGSFTLCLDDKPGYDFYEGAIELGILRDWSSSNAIYSTLGATPDKNAASCWNTSPNYNRWFKFTATTSQIHIKIRRGGDYGSVRRVNAAIWEEDGVTQVACKRYVYNDEIVEVESINLTPGDTYYLSVDNNYSYYRGTFSLYVNDSVDYDFYEGARDVTSLINSQSELAEYTTVGATSDRNAGSCWNTSPNYNRWFKFRATTPGINIKVLRGGSYGDIRRVNVALFESDGVSELECNRYVNNNDIVELDYEGLTPGNWYYFSVDNNYSYYRGAFTLALNDSVGYDYYEGALELVDINNWSSGNAEFTTIGATPDKDAASCWNTSPNYNRWFKFTATTPVINVEVRRGGDYGTIRRINAAIWEEDGVTQVACNRYIDNNDNVTVGSNTLTPGNTYYISVDNNYSYYRGSFSLYVDNSVDYDFYEGAYEISDLNGWESNPAEFSTIGATPDKNAASCWNTSPNYNRWFKFQAIHSDVSIQVLRGGSYGTVRRINLALWDSNGTDELACSRYSSNNDNVSIAYSGLTPGNWYYISVDNNYSAYRGSFTLQVNNVSGDEYYAIADGDWSIPATWSLSEGGPPALSSPGNGDVVHIKGYNVTVTGTETCAELEVIPDNANTSLEIDAGQLTVNGVFNFINSGSDYDGAISIVNGGNLSVRNNFVMERAGGGNAFQFLIQDNSNFQVENDLKFISSGGSSVNNEFTVSGLSTVLVERDLIFENSGELKSVISLNNTTELTVNRDIQYISDAQDKLEIELNNAAKIKIGRNITRGVDKYGILNSKDNTTVVFESADYLQVIPENAGGGTDSFSYQNIEINNSRITSPQLRVEGPVSVPGVFNLVDGVIQTSASNLLSLENSGSILGGSKNSYIEGPLEIIGDSAVTFPVGKNGMYKPIAISAPALITDAFIAEYFNAEPDALYDISLHESSIDHVSNCEYWEIERSSGSSAVNLTAFWDGSGCCITNLTALKIAAWDGTEWKDYGNGFTNGNVDAGVITSSESIDINSYALTFADNLPVVDLADPGGPYCESAAPVILTGVPQDSNGIFAGEGIIDNGDGTATFSPAIAGNGIHEIEYTYVSGSGCSNSIIREITVFKSPTANVLGTDTVCVGVPNDFSIYLTGTPPWNITYTDGSDTYNVVTSENPYIFTSTNPGTYSVTALTDGSGCAGTDLGNSAVLVNWPHPGKPSTNIFSGTTTFCEGENIILETNPAQIYYWNNGVSTRQNTITESGDYWVSIIDENGCFSDNSDTTTVIVNKTARKPLSISGNDDFCQNQSNTSYSSYSLYADTYNWDLQPSGAGTIIGNGPDIEIDWEDTFSGIAKLSVYGSNVNCGSGPTSDTLYISLDPLPDNPGPISGDQVVCQGQGSLSYSIDPVPNATSYAWNLPANVVFDGSSNGNSITVNYLDNATSGDIQVTAFNPCGASLGSSSVTIDVQTESTDPSGINITNNNICQGTPKTLSVVGGSLGVGATWKWYLDSGFTTSAGPDGPSLIVDPADTTEYWVRAEGFCNNTNAVSGIVFTGIPSVPPTSASSDRNNICPGDGNIILSYTGGSLGDGATAEWYDDAGLTNNIGSGNNLEIPAPATTTTYYVRFEGDCNNTVAESITVNINTLPSGTLSSDDGDNTICSGSSITFTATDGANYEFTVNGGPVQDGPDATYLSSTLSDGDVVGVNVTSAGGCEISYTPITITVNALPSVSFAVVADMCLDAADFTLTEGSPAGGSYSGPGVSGDTFSPSTAGAGTHTITYSYTDSNGCMNSATQAITVNALPTPVISGPAESCLNGNGVFTTPDNPDHSYSWDITGGTASGPVDSHQVSVDFGVAGTANIEVTETNDINGCSATSGTHNVTVYDKPSIGEIESNNKLTRK